MSQGTSNAQLRELWGRVMFTGPEIQWSRHQLAFFEAVRNEYQGLHADLAVAPYKWVDPDLEVDIGL